MATLAVDLRRWTREEYEWMAEQGFFRPRFTPDVSISVIDLFPKRFQDSK